MERFFVDRKLTANKHRDEEKEKERKLNQNAIMNPMGFDRETNFLNKSQDMVQCVHD